MLIQEVYRVGQKFSEARGRLVFLEDYDMNLARYLVQGVDVWLNTPRRPKEASGTSGQKAALNGVLNFSVLDGWWREGYNGQNGWAIGKDIDYDYTEEQDAADAVSLYNVLENEIIPLYYWLRSSDGLPGEWLERMKNAISYDRAAIQHTPHGQRICGAFLYPCDSGKSEPEIDIVLTQSTLSAQRRKLQDR